MCAVMDTNYEKLIKNVD